MLRGAERPVEFNPFSDIANAIDEINAARRREIDELREILSRPRHHRRRDD